MKRIPPEIRAAIVSRYRRGGITYAALAVEFGISKEAVGRFVNTARERETLTLGIGSRDLPSIHNCFPCA